VTWYDVLRYAVFGVLVLSAASAVGSWAIQTRRINPFGRLGQLIRRTTDPIVAPFETWLLKQGKNPQSAPWWLLGVTVVGGILVLTGAQWVALTVMRSAGAAAAGPRGIARLVVYYGTQLIILALIVRVIGSWFGVGRYRGWMKPFYWLTDWIVEPLRRIVPRFGMFDITPIIAWIVILILQGILLSLI
jgi:YggT family protein